MYTAHVCVCVYGLYIPSCIHVIVQLVRRVERAIDNELD